MEPEPTTTLTLDGGPIEEWLRTIIREEIEAAITQAAAQLSEILLGKTPTVEPADVRGMTCAQAVALTGMPCKGECTHNTDAMAGPTTPSVITDPDCFR